MCTVLQQHLNQLNGFDQVAPAPSSSGRASMLRTLSPTRLPPQPTYSYLQDLPNLKKPIDPYDKRCSTPSQHFHVPPPDSRQARGRSYIHQLLGRRSRSHSRSGMRALVEQLEASAPRPRSPHMNNEEAINLSHYPDGRAPEERAGKVTPIERDDFPAPPYAYADGTPKRRRRWSEPSTSSFRDSSRASTPVQSSSDENEEEFVDEKLDRTEQELKRIASEKKGGMSEVFLQELAVERERRKALRHRLLDPRSAARTPAANKEPHYRLRYDSPVNASPSRIADHFLPWDDDFMSTVDGGTLSRRSNVTTPFLPQLIPPQRRVVSPVHPIRPGYTQQSRAQTLPSRFSPGFGLGGLSGYDSEPNYSKTNYSTDYSSNKSDDLSGGEHVTTPTPTPGPAENVRVCTTYTQRLQAAQPRNRPQSSQSDLNRSLPNVSSPLQAPNIYPLHLLFTTNYRLPGDVDRSNLEKHLSDTEFEMVFRMPREDFYQLPYWKRCDLKRRYYLF